MPERTGQVEERRVERRAAPRSMYTTKALCRLSMPPREDSWVAEIRDLSVQGVGVVARVKFEPGTLPAIELRSPNWQFLIPRRIHIVRATPLPDGHWSLGGRFTMELTPNELIKLLR
jgi:hypothetical protein